MPPLPQWELDVVEFKPHRKGSWGDCPGTSRVLVRTEQHPKSAPMCCPIAVSSLREGRTRQGVADPTFTQHATPTA